MQLKKQFLQSLNQENVQQISGTETTTSFTKAVIQEMEEQALVGRGR